MNVTGRPAVVNHSGSGALKRYACLVFGAMLCASGCQPEANQVVPPNANAKSNEVALLRLRPGANPPPEPLQEVLLRGNPDYNARVASCRVSPRQAAEILESEFGPSDRQGLDPRMYNAESWLRIHRMIIDGEYLFSRALDKVDYGRVDLSGYYVNCDTGVVTIRNADGTLWIDTGRRGSMPKFK